MSIEMDNPTTPLEIADAIGNLIAQMWLAHKMRDEATFTKAHTRAAELSAALVDMLDSPLICLTQFNGGE